MRSCKLGSVVGVLCVPSHLAQSPDRKLLMPARSSARLTLALAAAVAVIADATRPGHRCPWLAGHGYRQNSRQSPTLAPRVNHDGAADILVNRADSRIDVLSCAPLAQRNLGGQRCGKSRDQNRRQCRRVNKLPLPDACTSTALCWKTCHRKRYWRYGHYCGPA